MLDISCSQTNLDYYKNKNSFILHLTFWIRTLGRNDNAFNYSQIHFITILVLLNHCKFIRTVFLKKKQKPYECYLCRRWVWANSSPLRLRKGVFGDGCSEARSLLTRRDEIHVVKMWFKISDSHLNAKMRCPRKKRLPLKGVF